jgi:hypothetical protein
MTKNLFDLTYELAAELGILTESHATGGSTTTVVDTVRLTHVDDYWNLGTVWITYDAAGAGAAPQGEFARISDFANGTSTATIAAVTTAVAATDRYAIADKKYKLDDLIMAINRAIRDAPQIITEDLTSLDTAAAQTEYTLPTGINTSKMEVWLEMNTSDADDNQWFRADRNVYIQKTAGGTADTLVFKEQPPYPRDVKLVYTAPHAALVNSTDKLDESIRYERIIYRAAVHALNHYRMITQSTDKYLLQTIQDYVKRADEADRMYPVPQPKKLSNVMIVGPSPTVELAPGENTIP